MDKKILKLMDLAVDSENTNFEDALIDLRLLIEKNRQNRFFKEDDFQYLRLFKNIELVDLKLSSIEMDCIKYFLFFLIFNFPDRSVLVAKCIKVFADTTIREAICAAVEYYMEKDDSTTCELIFSITNVGDIENYLTNNRIIKVFNDVILLGGEFSKKAALIELDLFNSLRENKF